VFTDYLQEREINQKTIRELNMKLCMSRKFRIHPFVQTNA